MGATVRIAILANAAQAKREMRAVAGSANNMGDRLKRVNATMQKVAFNAAKVAGAFSSFAAAGVAAGLAVAKVAVGAAKLGGTLAPLVAFAPGLAAGFGFLKLTLQGLGKSVAVALKPVADGFVAARAAAGALAARGLPALAAQFNRVNLPAVSDAMNRIGVAANSATTGIGRWVNSATGIGFVREVTDGIAGAFERATPSIERAGIALLNLATRAGTGTQLKSLGDTVARVADRFTQWADSLTQGDIANALDTVKNGASVAGDRLRMLWDGLKWAAENDGKIRAIGTALAALGLGLAIATGNPVAALAAGFTLLALNWDTVKASFNGAAEWWSGVWAGLSQNANLQALGSTVTAAFTAIRDALGPAFTQIATIVGPALAGIKDTILNDVVPALNGFIAAATPIVTWLIGVLAPVVGRVFAGIAVVIQGALQIISGIINIVTAVITGNWSRAWQGIRQVLSGVWTAIQGVARAAVGNLIGIIGGAVGAARAAAGRIVGGIVAAFAGIVGQMAGIGRNIVSGLIGGIRSMASAAWEAARSVVTGAVSAAKSALGINSPSRVFATLGAATGQGYVKGLKRSRAAVQAAAKKLLDLAKLRSDYAARVTQSLGGTRIADVVDPTANRLGVGAGAIRQALQNRLDEVRRFRDGLEALRRKGFGESVIQSIATAGIDKGLEFIDQLKGASKGMARQIKDLDSQLRREGAAFGDRQSVAEFRGRANEVGRDVRQQVIRIESSGQKIDDLLVELLRKRIRAAGGNVQVALGSR